MAILQCYSLCNVAISLSHAKFAMLSVQLVSHDMCSTLTLNTVKSTLELDFQSGWIRPIMSHFAALG